MTEARIVREGTIVSHVADPDDVNIRVAREAVNVGHHFPEALTFMRTGRVGVVVAISFPHGWGIFDDPALHP